MGNISSKKNLSFVLLNIILLNYFFFIFIFSLKIIPGFLMLIISLADNVRHGQGILEIFNSSDTYTTLLASIVLAFLWIKLIKGIAISLYGYFLLNQYLKSQVCIKNEKYTLINDSQVIAFTAGLFKPQVYISTGLKSKLNKKELKAVLLHENFHKKEYDPLKKYIANFLKLVLPFFPGKNSTIESYEVLSELSADNFAEYNIKSRRPIISALLKMFRNKSTSYDFMISSFSLKNNRVEILTENKVFRYKSFYTILLFSISFLALNTIVLGNTSIFIECKHISECFQILLSEKDNVPIKNKKICFNPNNYSPNYSCSEFEERHQNLYSEILPSSSI